MADAFDAVTGNMPQPQEHAIAAETTDASAAPAPAANADEFNPAIHAKSADGTPKRNSDGSLAKKRGRRAGSTVGATSKPGISHVATGEMSARAAGEAFAETLVMFGMAIGGADFTPALDPKTGTDERAMLRKAWGDYAEKKGWKDIPPGLAVIIATGAYIAPRFAKPTVSNRIALLRAWVGLKISAWRERRAVKATKGKV